jgi:hypothetical protein
MKNRRKRGNTIVEFSLVTVFFLLPMLLFTFGVGFNLLAQLEVVQFTRDAGHLFVTLHYGQAMSLNDPTFKTILGQVGANSGYPNNAGVIFAQVRFVDSATCALGGGTGSPATCPNSGNWVFTQYYTPSPEWSSFTSAIPVPSGATPKDTEGDYNLSDSVSVKGLRASTTSTFLGISSYNPDTNTGLPSGQTVFYVEVGAMPFNLPGVVNVPALNDHAVF